jgi:hypothetical protein
MSEIRESRSYRVHDVILGLHEIKKLAKVVDGEFGHANKGEVPREDLSFVVSCDDGSLFSSEDPSLFEQPIISSKRIHSIRMSYRNYPQHKSIAIDLRNGTRSRESTIEVTGTDSTWVNGTLRLLEDVMRDAKPQTNFFKKTSWLSTALLSMGLGYLIIHLLLLLPIPVSKVQPTGGLAELIENSGVARFIFVYLIYYVIGLTPAAIISQFLDPKDLWPSVELQIGPAHKLTERKRRFFLLQVLILGILPLLRSAVYDVLRALP